MGKLLTKLGLLLNDNADDPWAGWKIDNKEISFDWVNGVFDIIKPILYAIMGLVCAAGAVYAIVLGINLARAEDTSKREESKKHLITVLVAVFVTIALVIFFNEILPKIIKAFVKPSLNPTTTTKTGG